MAFTVRKKTANKYKYRQALGILKIKTDIENKH
jgi:hypothetical protein